jgi:uncharacterized protein YbaP (TraB family)
MWKVTKGENTLWILGTLSPLPKKMVWESLQVEMVLHDSQAYLLPPSVTADVGFFQGISLASSAIGIKKNPGKKKLKDVLPDDIYARWLVLKEKYLGNNRKIEKSRPIFAAAKLFDKAINKIGLTYNTKVEKKVRKPAKKNKLEFIRPTLKIELNKPKAALKKFKKSDISDQECFIKTLDRLEGDINNMRLRANAWAMGNIAKLQELTFPDQNKSCTSAILNNDIAKDVGMDNIKERVRMLWLEKAKESLNANKSTFAILSISNLLSEDGYLDSLAAEGYLIKSPK